MKIIFDCRYTRLGRHDGISRYGARLVEELAKLHPVTMLISDRRQLEMLPDLPWVMGPDPTAITEPWVARTVNRYEPDVVFTPMQTMGPGGRKYALVTTVHDLIYYRHRTPPRDLNPALRLLWRAYHLWVGFQRAVLNRADAHLVDSETTRDLMVAYRMTRNPMHVVLLGTEQPNPTPVRTAPASKDLVYMGSFMPYKNVDLLVSAMSQRRYGRPVRGGPAIRHGVGLCLTRRGLWAARCRGPGARNSCAIERHGNFPRDRGRAGGLLRSRQRRLVRRCCPRA